MRGNKALPEETGAGGWGKFREGEGTQRMVWLTEGISLQDTQEYSRRDEQKRSSGQVGSSGGQPGPGTAMLGSPAHGKAIKAGL